MPLRPSVRNSSRRTPAISTSRSSRSPARRARERRSSRPSPITRNLAEPSARAPSRRPILAWNVFHFPSTWKA